MKTDKKPAAGAFSGSRFFFRYIFAAQLGQAQRKRGSGGNGHLHHAIRLGFKQGVSGVDFL